MKTFAIIPVKDLAHSKTRLSSILSQSERIKLSGIMLARTLSLLDSIELVTQIVVVSSDREVEQICRSRSIKAKFMYENLATGVNNAVAIANSYSISQGADATIVIPIDIPLLTESDICLAIGNGKSERVVALSASQRFDGTNLLFRKPPEIIQTSYDNDSYKNHVRLSMAAGVLPKLVMSNSLAQDLDTPEDLAKFLREYKPNAANAVLDFLRPIVLREQDSASIKAVSEHSNRVER